MNPLSHGFSWADYLDPETPYLSDISFLPTIFFELLGVLRREGGGQK